MISLPKMGGRGRSGSHDVSKLKAGVVDMLSSAIMMVDRDFVVTYVNGPTRDLLKTHEAAFRSHWPNFTADKIVGMCIDTFHKNPAHQRKLLADPSKLPFRTEITVGELKIALLVNGLFDAKNNYVGNVLEWREVTADRLNAGMIDAICKNQGVAEFSMDGKLQSANENYLSMLGYSLNEIRGQPHSMFVDSVHRQGAEYRGLWEKLGRGDYDAGEYVRIGKGGKEIWIQASYNPVLDANGKAFKIVELTTDITERKRRTAEYEGQIAAIGKAQCVIEFTLDGKILNANENALKIFGYALDEIKGQHHSMFVEPANRQSDGYKAFWQKLARGEHHTGQYKFVGKGGKEVWLQASFNPISDVNGVPFKVVKYATDVTAQVRSNEALQQAVQQTQEVVKAAQANDLMPRIPMDGKSGEIASLCSGINGLIDTMASVIKKIKGAAREVSNASAEISASTTDLSQRTEEQAASLEETSASMEEMAATVKKNADNAIEANRSASETREVADRGGQVVSKAVEAMARIEESSRKISDIIGVIDEIARQTNLLALNAAVEAARAGDAGRGFAVVASEVRSLAQRSSQAAKDIKDLITNSNGQVKDGVDLVNRAGTALTDIVDSIKKVAVVVSDIATASTEQATGIEQINKALNQMDEVTQQNSALVEENAATAKTLEQQSLAMTAEVSVFKVGDDEAPVMSPIKKRSAAPAPKPAAPAKQRAKPASPVKSPNTPKSPVSPPRRATVGQMQTALAAAYQDPEWKDF